MRRGVHDPQASLEKSHPGEKHLTGHQRCHQHELLCLVVRLKQGHGLLLKRSHTYFAFLSSRHQGLHSSPDSILSVSPRPSAVNHPPARGFAVSVPHLRGRCRVLKPSCGLISCIQSSINCCIAGSITLSTFTCENRTKTKFQKSRLAVFYAC